MKYTPNDKELAGNYKKAFKDADIRGLYGSEINEEVAYRVANAFVQTFSITTLAVGHDMRHSSPALKDAFIAGATEAGADVIDVGLVTTPMLYFISGNESLHGVMITASHNPAAYNGLKLVLPGAIPLTNASGLKKIQKIVASNDMHHSLKSGRVRKQNIQKSYERYVAGKVSQKPSSLRVVVDCGNGMGTLLLPLIKKVASVTPLFATLDGSFPNRESNPTLKKSQRQIVELLKKGSYDLGVAFDGDADRVAFFDETGRYINAAHIGALLTERSLADQPGSSYVYTSFTSRVYLETIKAGGGKPVLAKVGHAFIKEQMRAHDAVFGCEHSAHFYFKDNFYADSGILTVLKLIKALAPAKLIDQPFSSLIKPFERYFQTEEILIEVTDKDAVLAAVKKWSKQQGVEKVLIRDGVHLITPTWWAVVKKSVTEDALKFVVESPKRTVATAQQKKIKAFLMKFKT